MKKILVIALAAVMLLTMSACSIKDVTRYAYAGDSAFYVGEYNFFIAQAMSSAMQTASNNGDTLATEKDWQTVMIEDMTAEEFVKDSASKNMKQLIVLMAKAKELGEEFTEEDKAALNEQRQSIIDNYGGRYSYEQYFDELGFDIKAVENVVTASIYAQKVSSYLTDPDAAVEPAPEAVAEEDTEENAEEKTEENAEKADKPNFYSEIKVNDEEVDAKYKADYVMAKHILIMSKPQETAEPEVVAEPEGEATEEGDAETAEPAEGEEEAAATKTDEELDAEAKAKAEDILKQLNDGADFDTLMKQNTQDVDTSGNINGENGYVFTKGEMVPEFEEAAFALKEGEFTKEPVKTDYGYHIIYRLPLPTEGEDYTAALDKVKTAVETEKSEALIDKWAEEFGFVLNEKAIKRAKLHIGK